MECAYRSCGASASQRVRVPGPGEQSLYVCFTHGRLLEEMMAGKSKCALTICDNVATSKGCCGVHYQRWASRGWVKEVERVTPDLATALHARWEKEVAEKEAARVRTKPKARKTPAKSEKPAKPPAALSKRWAGLSPDVVPEEPNIKPVVPPINGEVVRLAAQLKELEAQIEDVRGRAEKAEADRDEARENAQQLRINLNSVCVACEVSGEEYEAAGGARALIQKVEGIKARADMASEFCAEAQTALRNAQEAVGWSPDHALSFIEYLQDIVTQRAKAVAGEALAVEQLKIQRAKAEVQAPYPEIREASYLTILLSVDEKLRAAMTEAIARDMRERLLAKDPLGLVDLLNGPSSRIP